jgi:hypothetical protein
MFLARPSLSNFVMSLVRKMGVIRIVRGEYYEGINGLWRLVQGQGN